MSCGCKIIAGCMLKVVKSYFFKTTYKWYALLTKRVSYSHEGKMQRQAIRVFRQLKTLADVLRMMLMTSLMLLF